MSYQRSKAPLSLMEQLIMVFVFAFAAAVCLQAFVYSDTLSKDGTIKETAAVRATEVVETCKAYHGDLKKAADALQCEATDATGDNGAGAVLTKVYDDDGLRVELKTQAEIETGGNFLHQKADVSVYMIPKEDEKEQTEPVYQVEVAWQLQEQLQK
ncbi:MAG: hypothetical protein VZQ83_04185 [Eubacterium sp.]|nr:hypothetical protein [Eubacterium sp.]